MLKSYLLILVALCAALVLAAPVANTRTTTASALNKRARHSHDDSSHRSDNFSGSHGHSRSSGDSSSSSDDSSSSNDDSSSSNDDSSSSSDDSSSSSGDSSSSSGDSSSNSDDNSSSSGDSSSSSDDSSNSSDDSSNSSGDSSGSSSSGSQFQGRGTWFSDTTGSCEVKFDQSDMIVALNEEQMGSLQGSGSQCGKMVRVHYGGKSVDVKVVDTCPSEYCDKGALDLSQAAFKELAGGLSKGVLTLDWEFI